MGRKGGEMEVETEMEMEMEIDSAVCSRRMHRGDGGGGE